MYREMHVNLTATFCDWKKYQHYSDRWPVWIKLHLDLMEHAVLKRFTCEKQAIFFRLLLHASKNLGRFEPDPHALTAELVPVNDIAGHERQSNDSRTKVERRSFAAWTRWMRDFLRELDCHGFVNLGDQWPSGRPIEREWDPPEVGEVVEIADLLALREQRTEREKKKVLGRRKNQLTPSPGKRSKAPKKKRSAAPSSPKGKPSASKSSSQAVAPKKPEPESQAPSAQTEAQAKTKAGAPRSWPTTWTGDRFLIPDLENERLKVDFTFIDVFEEVQDIEAWCRSQGASRINSSKYGRRVWIEVDGHEPKQVRDYLPWLRKLLKRKNEEHKPLKRDPRGEILEPAREPTRQDKYPGIRDGEDVLAYVNRLRDERASKYPGIQDGEPLERYLARTGRSS